MGLHPSKTFLQKSKQTNKQTNGGGELAKERAEFQSGWVPSGTSQQRQIRALVTPDRWLTLGFRERDDILERRMHLSGIPIQWEIAQHSGI